MWLVHIGACVLLASSWKVAFFTSRATRRWFWVSYRPGRSRLAAAQPDTQTCEHCGWEDALQISVIFAPKKWSPYWTEKVIQKMQIISVLMDIAHSVVMWLLVKKVHGERKQRGKCSEKATPWFAWDPTFVLTRYVRTSWDCLPLCLCTHSNPALRTRKAKVKQIHTHTLVFSSEETLRAFASQSQFEHGASGLVSPVRLTFHALNQIKDL